MGPYLLLEHIYTGFFHSDLLSNQKKEAECLYTFTTVELKTIKEIRRLYASKFNDVVLAAIAGAIKRSLLEIHAEILLPKIIPMLATRDVPNRPAEICNHL